MIKRMKEQGVNPIDLRQELKGIDWEVRTIKEQKNRLIALGQGEFNVMTKDQNLKTNVLEKVKWAKTVAMAFLNYVSQDGKPIPHSDVECTGGGKSQTRKDTS